MMQFLTKKILKNDKKTLDCVSCEKRISKLENEVNDLRLKLKEQNSLLRQFSILNDSLCSEITVIGRWLVKNFASDDSELSQKFGIFDSKDDEYLN